MSTGNSPCPPFTPDEDEYEPSLTCDCPDWPAHTLPPLTSPSRYSTGDTPSPTNSTGSDIEDDDYEPPPLTVMAPLKPPKPFTFSNLDVEAKATQSLDRLHADCSGTKMLRLCELWQVDTRRLAPEQLEEIVFYGCHQLHDLRYQLDQSQRRDVAEVLATTAIGLVAGMPLTILAWEVVTKDIISRMCPMMLRSAILQACAALDDLRTRAADLRDVLITFEAVKSRGVVYTVEMSPLEVSLRSDSSCNEGSSDGDGFGKRDSPILGARVVGKGTMECEIDALIAEEKAACRSQGVKD